MTDLMHPWLHFLASQGARFDDGQTGLVAGYAESAGARPAGHDGERAAGYLVPLTDLGLIAASGEEAVRFLHNQLTNDVEHLPPGQARRAGYCSPKGRLLASFLYWRAADTILLQLPRALQAGVQKRLQMFVLRSKVKLADVSADQVALGLGGHLAATALAAWFPELPSAVLETRSGAAGTLIRFPDAFDAPRYMWVAPRETAQQAWQELTAQLRPEPTAYWHLAEIRAGIAQITAPTQEQFVPQMVNLEVVDGVSFKKGCYPGQEIVARTQYLGKLKRRTLPATVAADTGAAAAGTELYSSADPGQPCGMVVNAAPAGSGTSALLAELKLAALEAGTVHLGSPEGPKLEFHQLPYALP